ncbi:MAG: asparagine synthetase A [Candidatus Bipolaricaulota bacterium]|nr:asparagine synthetase A [Candidatus Bipolaricaulota bacterium]MDW8151528.1 asparagine synthetase A [Candidatus Bipolaricaulota bacterium]
MRREALALEVTSVVLGACREFLAKEGFVELLPVILAPVTDPLRTTPEWATLVAYGRTWYLTRSMIFHKQAAVRVHPKIFCFSPNVRLEPPERAQTGRHLFEFVQLDLEVRGATREEVMDLGERLLLHVLSEVRRECGKALKSWGRELPEYARPFPRIPWHEAHREFGADLETELSRRSPTPVWLVDFPIDQREFYDREDPARPGILRDMDLLYPEGFGEALSGGEREYQPERIKDRILRQGLPLEAYRPLLDLAEDGLFPSAGFGIGVERLVRFLCGFSHVAEVRLFPRVPGGNAPL